jgi:uncharacterized protein YgiM (DUF1202 family)
MNSVKQVYGGEKKNDGESKKKCVFPDYKGFDVSSLARRAREEEEKKIIKEVDEGKGRKKKWSATG